MGRGPPQHQPYHPNAPQMNQQPQEVPNKRAKKVSFTYEIVGYQGIHHWLTVIFSICTGSNSSKEESICLLAVLQKETSRN